MAKATPKKRAKSSNVSLKIIELLKEGRKQLADLSASGGFSQSSGFLNMKKLVDSGAVISSRDGRSVYYELSDSPAGNASVALSVAPTERKAKVRAPAAVGETLRSALDSLSFSLAPIENLKDKVQVLGALATAVPGPIGSLLNAIIVDLQRSPKA